MAEFMIEQYWTKARDGMGFQVLRSLFITRGWKGDAAAVLYYNASSVLVHPVRVPDSIRIATLRAAYESPGVTLLARPVENYCDALHPRFFVPMLQ